MTWQYCVAVFILADKHEITNTAAAGAELVQVQTRPALDIQRDGRGGAPPAARHPAQAGDPLEAAAAGQPPGAGRGRAQVLRAVHVPLPLGQAAHGPRAGLLHLRHIRPLLPHARLQSHPPDGLGRLRAAGGERRAGARRVAGGVDPGQHRQDAGPAAPARLRLRLGPGAGYM